jgi:hypothetical protein
MVQPKLAIVEDGDAGCVLSDHSQSLLEELAAHWRVPLDIAAQHAFNHTLTAVRRGGPVFISASAHDLEPCGLSTGAYHKWPLGHE